MQDDLIGAFKATANPVSDEASFGEPVADLLVGDPAASSLVAPARGTNTHTTGFPLIDKGTACDDVAGPECFLDLRQRSDLKMLFTGGVLHASQQLGAAISATRTETLMLKDQDPHWFAMLVLDVVGGFLLSKFASALLKVRRGTLLELAEHAPTSAIATASVRGLNKVDGKHLEKVMKPALDATKNAAKQLWRGEDLSRKDLTVQYLDQLATKVGIGYSQIRMTAMVGVDDAGLVALTHAFEPEEHTFEKYKAALDRKMDRLSTSGVFELGSHKTDRPTGIAIPALGTEPVERQLRVIRLRYRSGRPDRLAFQQSDGMPLKVEQPRQFNEHMIGSGDVDFSRFVPSEFEDVAVSRHIAVWRQPPISVWVEDAWWMQAKAASPPSASASSAPTSPTRGSVPPVSASATNAIPPSSTADSSPPANSMDTKSEPASSSPAPSTTDAPLAWAPLHL